MIFCNECFNDSEIRSIIERKGNIGYCPICKIDNVFLYDTENDSELNDTFNALVSIYTAESDLPSNFPKESIRPIEETIKEDWNIFSNTIEYADIKKILKALSTDIISYNPNIFTESVGLPESFDDEYLQGHSILHTKQWSDFVEEIKHKNRFHTSTFDIGTFRNYCIKIEEEIKPGKLYYRGRISPNSNGFIDTKKLGAPPKENATAGRANSKGISRLYLTDDFETTFHEIRAAEYDYVTIGTFELLETIKVVNLTRLGEHSPFNDDVDLTAMAINLHNLKKINDEMSHPMRKGDSDLDYLPTQYIADFIMSMRDENGNPMYDGIRYQSAMHNEGSNLAIFYPEKFTCIGLKTYEINNIEYGHNLINNL